MKLHILFTLIVAACWMSSAQSFKGHQIGESAETFFSKAKMMGTERLSSAYCKEFLGNPKNTDAFRKHKPNLSGKAALQYVDCLGCQDVTSALAGADAEVGARYADELGDGRAMFHAGKLVALRFDEHKVTLDDIVTQIRNELGVQPKLEVKTFTRYNGTTGQSRTASWTTNNLYVYVIEIRASQHLRTDVQVLVADTQFRDERKKHLDDAR